MIKFQVKIVVAFTFLIFSILFGSTKTVAQQKTQQVRIYLCCYFDYDPNDSKNIFGLSPVLRSVSASAPLRGALEALLAGPTIAEEAKGITTSTSGVKLASVNIKNGTAYTYFTQPSGTGFPGDMAPSRFRDAVERTAKQFSSVKKVIICLDGILNFDDESERTITCRRRK